MSNDIPSRDEIAEQAGSSSGDGSEERRREQLLRENRAKLRANMTIQEKKDYFDKLAKDFKTYFSNDEVGVDIMLSYEEGGFLPNPDLKKHFLKGKLENNPFKTQEWRTWWDSITAMPDDEMLAQAREMVNNYKKSKK